MISLLQYVNQTYEEQTGHSSDRLVGSRLSEVFGSPESGSKVHVSLWRMYASIDGVRRGQLSEQVCAPIQMVWCGVTIRRMCAVV